MQANHKVICVTPAGRRRYMRILVPYILSSSDVDEYHIWLNTIDKADIHFLKSLEPLDKVKIIEQPDGLVSGNASINAFFRQTLEDDTVYIRFDDDIIWMEQDTIKKSPIFVSITLIPFLFSQ